MLQLSSQIAYTSEPNQDPQRHTVAGVTVLAEVVDLETGERKKSNTVSSPASRTLRFPRTNDRTSRELTNSQFRFGCKQFHFSFDLGETDRQVLPQTYKEAMEFIEGKRRVEIGAEMRRLYQGEPSDKPELSA